jgi:predicted dehydrogenase
MTDRVSVGLVGVGTIAATHLEVLAAMPQVVLDFVADPDPTTSIVFREARPPVYRSLADALEEHRPGLVVVATPTSTHAALAREALATTSGRVLLEKPLVDGLEALAALRTDMADADLDPGRRLFVAHHFAFSPEVQWAVDQLAAHPEWGPVTGITSCFHDPYMADPQHSFAAYGSSWIDSGVNQLSMLTRFVELAGRGPLHESDGGVSAWCSVPFTTGTGTGRGLATGVALLRTSWQAVASSKRTTLRMEESGVEIWLDHTAVTAFVTRSAELLDALVNDGRTPRKIAHYRPLYRSLLSATPDPVLGYATACRLVEVLHGGGGGGGGA